MARKDPIAPWRAIVRDSDHAKFPVLKDWLEENGNLGFAALKRIEPTEHARAREIMGDGFHGIADVERHFGALDRDQWLALLIIPFTEETLRACAETHILVADAGMSILGMGALHAALFYDQDWYEDEAFARRTETARWRLIRKTPVENSFGETWTEQQALIDFQTDEIPSARQVVCMMILHFLSVGERLFETCWVRTSDVGSYGDHVDVGYFGEDGLSVGRWNGNVRRSSFGVASARKADPCPWIPRSS